MASPVRNLIKEVRSQGARIEHGTNHVKIYYPANFLVAVVPRGSKAKTEGFHNRNLKSALRRAGLEVS